MNYYTTSGYPQFYHKGFDAISYSTLSIDQKINFKGNLVAKTICWYGEMNDNWSAMKVPVIKGDIPRIGKNMFNGLKSFSRRPTHAHAH